MADLNSPLFDSNRRTKLSSSKVHYFSLGNPYRNIDTVRPESTTSLQCELCKCVQLFTTGGNGVIHESLPYFCQRFFHDRCTTCLPPEPSLEPLCSFCNHLQLPHIFGCVTPELEHLPSSSSEIGFSIDWGKGYKELLGDQTCPLCALIGTILRSRATKMDKVEHLFGDFIFVDFIVERQIFDRPSFWKLRIRRSQTPQSKAILATKGIIATISMKKSKERSGKETYSDPPIGLDVNWDQVKRWMGVCHLHQRSRQKSIETTDKDFRLVDLWNNCLVNGSQAWSYAALSYVWGNPRAWEAQTVLANVSQLEQKGGLLLHELPQCILDAQTACKHLGIRFLWVDRLCIIQDDAKSKHGQIKEMGNIYASAVVTIVAAAGKNARYGLIGISKPRAFPQQRLVLQGVEFTETLGTYDFFHLMNESMWRSRGWTFQEEKLSTALLVFTERGAFFRCKHNPKHMRIEGQSGEDMSLEVDEYPIVVPKYSQRKLSFESDILNAFSGYLNMMFKDKHYFGLPCAYFNSALLWRSADDSGLPRESNGNDTFPSWSWASRTGYVSYQSWYMPGNHEPVASWAAILFPPGSTSPQLLPVCEVPSKLPSLQELLRKKLYWKYGQEKFAWKRYILKKRLLSPILNDELIRFWTTLPRQVKSYKGVWFQNRWLSIKHNLFPNVIAGLEPREVFRADRLLAYTQITNISVTRLVWPTSIARLRNAPFVLRNKCGKWIGFVDPDTAIAERIDAYALTGETYSAECLALSLHRENANILPFSLLLDENLDTLHDRAERPNDGYESQEMFKKRSHEFWREMGGLKHQIQEAKRETPPCPSSPIDDPHWAHPLQLTVMMIKRTEGVARRAGVGNVYLKRWRESAPSFQTVVLE